MITFYNLKGAFGNITEAVFDLSVTQAVYGTILSHCNRNIEIAIRVNINNEYSLLIPVIRIILHNAETIYSDIADIADPQCPKDPNRIPESPG